jgi:hypothetical protein
MAEAIAIIGYGERVIQRMAASGQIPGAMKLPGCRCWTFDLAMLRRWIKDEEAKQCQTKALPSSGVAASFGPGRRSPANPADGAYEQAMRRLRGGWRLALDGQVGLTLTRRRATARSRRSVVYFIAQRGLVKIGFTQDIVLRLKHLQAASPVPLRLLFMLRGRASLEASLHARFRDLRCHNERFRLEGALLDHCRHRIGPSSPALLSCIPGGDDAQA